MVVPERLGDAAITEWLPKLDGWERRGDALYREYTCADFRAAMGFMVAVADVAEGLDHHPDWRNVYRRVEITLTTHDAGGITRLDFELAERIGALAQQHGAV